jgi:hypothetical protein
MKKIKKRFNRYKKEYRPMINISSYEIYHPETLSGIKVKKYKFTIKLRCWN